MREQASPGTLPRPRAGSDPLRVLLATEGFPAVGGAGSGDGQLAEALVRALPEVEFVVSTRTPPEASDQGRRGGREAPRVAGRDAERAFIPLFHDLLGEITRGDFDPDRFAGLLSALRAHFQVWDYRATWRSRAVWDALRKRAVPAVEVLGEGSGDTLIASRWSFPGEREGSLGHEAPTIGESAEAVRFLYRSLRPVTAELPVTDLSHAMSAGPCAIPCILAKVERETPFLLTEATVYLREQYLALARGSLPLPLKRLLLRFSSALAQTAYHLADRVSPVSEWVGQWERTYGVPAARIQVVYPGVDGEAFGPMPFPRSSRPTVVSFSPIAPAEDLETMLEVADRVRRSIPDVVFLHHGPVADGAYWERIRALTRERLLEDTVRFMGPTERVATAFNCADVTLSTSTGEGFPPKVIESLACGTPVVATAVGGIREALDGPGVTAPPGDAERLAEAVVAILRLPAGQRERLKEAARSTAVQKFALSTFADRYLATYRQLAGLAAEPVEPVVDLVAEPVVPLGEPIVVPDIAWNSEGMPALVSVAAFDRPAQPMPRPARTVPAHIRLDMLEDDAPVRVGALSRATDRPDAVDVIASALADDAPQVRREAVRALMRIGGSMAGRALSDALAHDPSSEVRREAVSALAALLARRAGGF